MISIFFFFLFSTNLSVMSSDDVFLSEWNEFNMNANFPNWKEDSHTYRFFYSVINGTVENDVELNLGHSGIRTKILPSDDSGNSTFNLIMPKNFPYGNAPGTDEITLIQNGDGLFLYETDYVTESECFYKLSIPIEEPTSMILYFNSISEGMRDATDVVNTCLSKTIVEYQNNSLINTPIQQLKEGIVIDDISCKYPLELYLKDDTKPLCLSPKTFEKLVQRGYF